GTGLRVGGDLPKQFQLVHGKTILRHTLDGILSLPGLKTARVMIDPAWINAYHDAVQGLNLDEPVIGGQTRKQSVYNGLKQISHVKDEDIIVVHDAARPFVRPERVLAVIDAA